MQCPECKSEKIIKNGRRKEKQNYLCCNCNRQFINIYDKRGYSREVKEHCLTLCCNGMGAEASLPSRAVRSTSVSKADQNALRSRRQSALRAASSRARVVSKKVKGRKRHLLVDTMGLVLMVVVTEENISNAEAKPPSPLGRTAPKGQSGVKVIFQKLKSYRRSLLRLFLIYTNGIYRGEAFIQWAFDTYDLILEAVLRTERHKGA